MTAGVLFWVIYVVAFVFFGLGYNRAPEARWTTGMTLAVWVLVGLLGWKVFGPPIQ